MARTPSTKTQSKTDKSSRYTDPKLRERLKTEIQAGDKGGQPGQWSSRKAQLLKQRYEAEGGGYVGGKSKSQKNLSQWTKQDWTTQDGKAAAQKDGSTARYLPKKAWDQLSPAEKKATDQKKRAGSKAGRTTVANTPKAKAARKKAAT